MAMPVLLPVQPQHPLQGRWEKRSYLLERGQPLMVPTAGWKEVALTSPRLTRGKHHTTPNSLPLRLPPQ